jgi:hypothetical protein
VLYAAGAGLRAISTSFRQLILASAIMALALPMSTAIPAASFDSNSRLGIDSEFVMALRCLRSSDEESDFYPANQKVAFATVGDEDYDVLAQMLSSFGTAAGTIGTTTAVALMEINASGDLWTHAAAFAGAQQFAFTCLALVGLVGIAAV